MSDEPARVLADTGERMIPPGPGEVSFVWERHRFAYAFALDHVENRRVLDVGCGTGYGSDLLATRASRVLALDQDAAAISYCRDHYARDNLHYEVADANRLSHVNAFDVVLSFQVIEHVPDPHDFLRRLRQAAVPGGTVLVTTPNVREPEEGPSGNLFHVSEMNADQLRALAAAVFTDYDVWGVGYSRPNPVRKLVQRTPLYRLGRLLKRSSAVKRVADRALDLRRFQIIRDRIHEDAIDLLLVGRISKTTGTAA